MSRKTVRWLYWSPPEQAARCLSLEIIETEIDWHSWMDAHDVIVGVLQQEFDNYGGDQWPMDSKIQILEPANYAGVYECHTDFEPSFSAFDASDCEPLKVNAEGELIITEIPT